MSVTVQQVLDSVRQEFGITFSEIMTGGGCMALESRLESGHWIVATDDNLCALSERIESESYADSYNSHDGENFNASGWFVGIYANTGQDSWMDGSGSDAIYYAHDSDAYAIDLVSVIRRVLADMVSDVSQCS